MKPNFLIFMTDQQRGDMQPTFGKAKMPNLERLAENGVVFRRAYCPSPHCCPSRATFFSGLYPSQHGVWNNVNLADALSKGLYDNVRLFSEDLKENGYHLYHSGKWHISALEGPQNRGFEQLNRKNGQTGEPQKQERVPDMRDWSWFEKKDYLKEGALRGDGEIVRIGFPEYRQYGETENPFGDEDVVRAAREKIRELPEDEPFCMYVGTLGPHDPYFVPKKYLELYPLEEIELPESFEDDLMDKPNLYRRTQKRFRQLTREEQKRCLQHYLAFCSYEDALFGEILKELEDRKLLDRTIVIYLSDHGDYAAAHGLWTKGLPCFEEAYHICSVVGYGGIQAKGKAVEAFVSLADYAPTFLELAGISVSRQVESAHVDVLADGDLDPACAGPQLDLGIEVEGAGVLRGPHVDRRVGQRVDLDLLAADPLGVAHDQSLRGEHGRVAERLVRRDRALLGHEQGGDVLRDRALLDEGPRCDRRYRCVQLLLLISPGGALAPQ